MNNKLKILIALLLTFIIIDVIVYQFIGKEIRHNLKLRALVPKKYGVWAGRELPINKYVLKAVKADSQVWKHYCDGNGNNIEVWIAFYNDQVESTAHNPNTCFNGQGWATVKT